MMKRDKNAIECAAAEWVTRHEQGLSCEEKRAFAAWVDADPRHEPAFRGLRRAWGRLDELRGSSAAFRLEAELYEVLGEQARRPVANCTGEAAEIVRLPRERAARISWRAWLSGAVAAALVFAAAGVTWRRTQEVHGAYAATAATEVGALRKLTLPDGSAIHLNTDSAVEVLFSTAERRVRLGRGEAFFTIAKHPGRPFVVNAAGVDVRALGTAFNVRLQAQTLEVTVREGTVRIDAAGSDAPLLVSEPDVSGASETRPAVLTAGHRVVIPVAGESAPPAIAVAPVTVASEEIERALAWQNRLLVFESAPLSAIVAELNRYHRRPILIADEALAARRFGGTFRATDPDTFIELLRTSYDVACEEREDATVLRLRH